MAVNKVLIKGNISSEVELKQTQSGTSVCSFNVAVNRFTKDPNEAKKADFFTVIAWSQKAEFVSRYFIKVIWRGNGYSKREKGNSVSKGV